MDEADLQRRLGELEAENARLRARLTDEHLADDLNRALLEAAAAGRLAAPLPHAEMLDQIVTAAAHVLHANAASLFLIDEEAGELVFEVALGEKAAEVKKFRLPLGQGLAGYVAATGQALAVADVARDQRWAREIGQAVEYLPRTLVAVPLLVADRVIGVLELLDKDGGQPFGMEDMQIAGHFAAQAAAAIEQSRAAEDVTGLLRAALAGIGGSDLTERATRLARREADGAPFRETLQMATTLGEIARRGDAERRLSLRIVDALGAYVRERSGE